MRISSASLALVLVGCSSNDITDEVTEIIGDPVECALGGATKFAPECTIERGDGTVLTLRHRDGGFRRLVWQSGGVIDTADGAETVGFAMLNDGRTEISVGDDRYRLPAKL